MIRFNKNDHALGEQPSMRGYAVALVFALVLVACDAREAANTKTVEVFQNTPVGVQGIGTIKIGMSRKQAEEASGEPIVVVRGEENFGPERCRYGRLQTGPKGLSFMLTGETIARIDVEDNAAIKTPEGAHVGSSEGELKAAYGPRLKVLPHKYKSGWHVLSVIDSEPAALYEYAFETNGRIVQSYRAGRLPEVAFAERVTCRPLRV